MTSPYTCITCQVAFRDLEIQRQHYKSDWHRYNLKRKVADFPPVTVEEFQKRVIAQRNKEDFENSTSHINCKPCKKHFSTKNQYDNHLLSKKHKDKVKDNLDSKNEQLDEILTHNSLLKEGSSNSYKKSNQSLNDMEIDLDVESVDSDEWAEDTENPVKNNDCLFCNHHSKSFLRNIKHMTVAHSFFIPDPEYCTDMKGLITYLGEKIYLAFMCIWCNDTGKTFHTAEAAKAHMIDKGHCKMLHEGDALVEYNEFYDYSTSYPEASEDPDAEVIIPELDDNDFQLVLPSGNIIGHRSLMKYYKQNLNPNSLVYVSKKDKLHKVLSQYRALGWTDTKKEEVVKKVRDIKYMQRIQSKYSTMLQFKANKLQKHFRPQCNF
ncbi:cytoplasmic 60S subunit biogenesis factor ZNF622 [Prorops nasuta]|uniref:cytoplasmic 60S subunit biogenesis factor ZNF622 n=1 Tax=Prorops nasuta TaxID=863751 RepID=UPI0034CEFA67